MGLAWLWPAIAVEDDVRHNADLAAIEVVDMVATIVDSSAWLREAQFTSICYAIMFTRADGKESTRVRRGELELQTYCDPDLLPTGHAAVRWKFFLQVLRDLERIGEKYGLGNPPLKVPSYETPEFLEGGTSLLPPGNADFRAELAALEDDEVLVAVPSELPDEDRVASAARRTKTEEAVSRLLGPSRAGSTAGDAYVWAFPLPT